SAAGLATLEIYEKEKLFERAADLADYFRDSVMELRELDAVTDIRGYGLIAGFDLAVKGAPGARGFAAQKRLFEAGLHIKFTGDAGIIAPPLVSEKKHIDEMCGIFKEILRDI
ncbi:MAG: aminotransferase class III-fold pyridoxal phosphate-dependent enzyme, partial [Alphaproteobacteria bacterium]|nr:aminotransferase class III-fold pyridoxal phosphate-dependent enzyme [Alphaproteobacteria bacterium]